MVRVSVPLEEPLLVGLNLTTIRQFADEAKLVPQLPPVPGIGSPLEGEGLRERSFFDKR